MSIKPPQEQEIKEESDCCEIPEKPSKLNKNLEAEMKMENDNDDNSSSSTEGTKSSMSVNVNDKSDNDIVGRNSDLLSDGTPRKRKRSKTVCKSKHHRNKSNSVESIHSEVSFHSASTLLVKQTNDSYTLIDEDISCFTVSNVPLNWSYLAIKQYLERICGPIHKLKMVKDAYGNFMGNIQLTFDDCMQAMEKLEGKEINDIKLVLEMSGADQESDSEANPEDVEPPNKKEKSHMAWRPDLDVWEMDPKGLYGLKLEYLRSLGINPPIDKWIHVSNFRCDKFDLKEVLNLAGHVLMCSVVTARDKFAKVMYSHPLEAVQAISMLNGQKFYGMPLKVSMCKCPITSVILPKGLPSIGPGLGVVERPLRDVVRQYERYIQGQSSLLKQSLFVHPNDLLNNFNKDVEFHNDQPETSQRSAFDKPNVPDVPTNIDDLRQTSPSNQGSKKNELFDLIDMREARNDSVSDELLLDEEEKASLNSSATSKSIILDPLVPPPGVDNLELKADQGIKKTLFLSPPSLNGSTPYNPSTAIVTVTSKLGPIGARPPMSAARQRYPPGNVPNIIPSSNQQSNSGLYNVGNMANYPIDRPQVFGQQPSIMGQPHGPSRPQLSGTGSSHNFVGLTKGTMPHSGVNQSSGAQFGLQAGVRPLRNIGPQNNYMTVLQEPPCPGPMIGPHPLSGANFFRPHVTPGRLISQIPAAGPPSTPMVRSQGYIGPKSKLEIRNLPPSTSFNMLGDIFSKFGNIISMQLTVPGCAVVQFANTAQAQNCYQQMNRSPVHGFIIEMGFID